MLHKKALTVCSDEALGGELWASSKGSVARSSVDMQRSGTGNQPTSYSAHPSFLVSCGPSDGEYRTVAVLFIIAGGGQDIKDGKGGWFEKVGGG